MLFTRRSSAHFPAQRLAPLGSVFSLSSFFIFFSVVEQVRFFLQFSFRLWGDWQVCYGKSVVGPKCEWFFSLMIGVSQSFFPFSSFLLLLLLLLLFKFLARTRLACLDTEKQWKNSTVHIGCEEVNQLWDIIIRKRRQHEKQTNLRREEDKKEKR